MQIIGSNMARVDAPDKARKIDCRIHAPAFQLQKEHTADDPVFS